MSRLNSQKRRLRAMQREEGIIAPDDLTFDAASFAEDGSSHAAIDAAASDSAESPNDPDDEVAPRRATKPKTVKRKAPKRR